MEGAFSMKAKIAYEEKIRIVRDYLSGKLGYSDSVKAANNSEATYRQWVAQYTAGGASALLPADRNKSYPATLKERAVKEYLSGKESLESICLNYQIRSITQLRR
jgi:transposase-like protein